MEDRLKKVFSNVFDIPVGNIDDNLSPDTVDEWDSLNHTNLVIALEQEFGVTFSPDEIIEMMNVELINIIIRDKTAKN